MRIKYSFNKIRVISAVIFSLISIACALWSKLSYKYVLVLPVVVLFASFISIEVYNQIISAVSILVMPLFMTVILQLETGSVIDDLGIKLILINWLLVTGFSALAVVFTKKVKHVHIICSLAVFLFGFIDALVIAFRGNQISINDIRSIRTALSVVGNYQFNLNPMFLFAIILFIAFFFFLLQSKFQVIELRDKGLVLVPYIVLTCSLVAVNLNHYTVKTWGNQGCTGNGVLFELLLEIKYSKIEEPEGYSLENVANIVEPYKTVGQNNETPNIIVVMSEAYSDLNVLTELDTNIPVMPNFEKVCSESLHGYALSSVFGGNTAVSEWEVLTGNSMVFMPQGSVAYQQYINEDVNSLVSLLKNRDYTAVAMHPYHASGWNRKKVFQYMGFDESLFLEDFEQTDLVRSYVSDREFYGKIISLFEGKDDDPLFVYGITMQNHGGYVYEDFESRVEVENLNRDYGELNQYLSLIHISDEALEAFINYFRDYDEKVVVLFYGDHQPRLSDEFYDEIGVADDSVEKYKVPFFIWKNYDSEEIVYELTSLNFLPALLLEHAQMEAPPYFSFLYDLKDDISAVNAYGYIDNRGGGYYPYNEETVSEGIKEQFNQYQMLQYANIFDPDSDKSIFN